MTEERRFDPQREAHNDSMRRWRGVSEIERSFHSKLCPHCAARKRSLDALCGRCYRSLDTRTRRALWQRFGDGFEQAFRCAMDELGNRDT